MDKLLLLSPAFATILLPVLFARHPRARFALQRTVLSMLAFNLVYLLALMYLYPRLL